MTGLENPWILAGIVLGLASAATVVAVAIARALRRHNLLLDEDGEE